MHYERVYRFLEEDEAEANEFYSKIAPNLLHYKDRAEFSFVACCVCISSQGLRYQVWIFVQTDALNEDEVAASLQTFIDDCGVKDMVAMDYFRPILATVNRSNIGNVLSSLDFPLTLVKGVASEFGALRELQINDENPRKQQDTKPKCYCGSGKRYENCHGMER